MTLVLLVVALAGLAAYAFYRVQRRWFVRAEAARIIEQARHPATVSYETDAEAVAARRAGQKVVSVLPRVDQMVRDGAVSVRGLHGINRALRRRLNADGRFRGAGFTKAAR